LVSRSPLPYAFLQCCSDLLAIVLASSLTLPLALYTAGPVRVAFAVVFLLFSPGYSLIAALYTRKESIDIIERLALSFGTSIAVVPLIGLILNYTPYGIRLTPILLSVYGFIVIMCGIACRQRLRLLPEERYEVHWSMPAIGWATMGTKDRILTGALIASIVFAVGTLIFVVTTPKEGERFTEFYILGPSGYADDYPESLDLNESTTLIMGIVNHENETVDYRVEARLDGDPDAVTLTTEGEGAVAAGDSIFELPGILDEAEWEHEITVTPLVAGDEQKLEFLLFSPRPRVGYYLRALIGEDGYVSIELDEEKGEAEVTLNAGESAARDCRIEAWQDGSLVAEQAVRIEAGEEERFTFEHPSGETLFRVYADDTLVLEDSGAELVLHLWLDVTA